MHDVAEKQPRPGPKGPPPSELIKREAKKASARIGKVGLRIASLDRRIRVLEQWLHAFRRSR
jgi:hypothetical protein